MSLAYMEGGHPKHDPSRWALPGPSEALVEGGLGSAKALEVYRANRLQHQRKAASRKAASILGEMSEQWAQKSQPSYLGLLEL